MCVLKEFGVLAYDLFGVLAYDIFLIHHLGMTLKVPSYTKLNERTADDIWPGIDSETPNWFTTYSQEGATVQWRPMRLTLVTGVKSVQIRFVGAFILGTCKVISEHVIGHVIAFCVLWVLHLSNI